MSIEFLEYPVKLSNGEVIKIAEIDIGRIDDPFYREALLGDVHPLNRIPRIPFELVEEMKLGYDGRIRNRLGSNPIAHLLQLKYSEQCTHSKTCITYNDKTCRLLGSDKSVNKRLLNCWEYKESDNKLRDLITSVSFKWAENFHVIITGCFLQ